ncbi:MAG: 4Fe-4S binding protein [Armatimonadota bacterium]|nr:MAG: 4Fe-4S binding protein [Armatimonadota bacterium]
MAVNSLESQGKVVIHFPKEKVDKPIICYLTSDYGVMFNILKAAITPEQEGLMVLELLGNADACERGLEYLRGLGLRIQPIAQDIIRIEERCTHCGACLAVCQVGALSIERPSMAVAFEPAQCVVCEQCLTACPTRAMQLQY